MANFVRRTWTTTMPATPDASANRWEAGIEEAINLADPEGGTAGQLLRKTENGTEWSSVGAPTDAQIEAQVTAWLTAHPEATTTVQDNSVTDAKLIQTGGILERVNNIYATDANGDGNVVLHLGG